MGRAFEFRKERKFKRWGHMARVFTKIGKEITIAVKQGGPDVTGNPRLRALIQTARSENMPKDNIERAIKRATDKDQADYKEVVFEGYGPHGIAVLVEAATDNNNRTVANVRSLLYGCCCQSLLLRGLRFREDRILRIQLPCNQPDPCQLPS